MKNGQYIIRAFVAIELPAELISELRAREEELIRAIGGRRGLSWVKPEKIHLTLKFLGEIEGHRVEEVGARLMEAAEGIPPFMISAEDVGGFPDLKSPRVLWAGIKENPALSQLQKNIDDRLCGVGFKKEDRPFKPHLTLCRIKSASDGKALGRAAAETKRTMAVDFKADSFFLMRSVLSPGGAEYSVIKRIPLKAS